MNRKFVEAVRDEALEFFHVSKVPLILTLYTRADRDDVGYSVARFRKFAEDYVCIEFLKGDGEQRADTGTALAVLPYSEIRCAVFEVRRGGAFGFADTEAPNAIAAGITGR